MVFAIALLIDAHSPMWIGLIGIAGGVSTAMSGVVIAYTGFDLAMATNMPAAVVMMGWIIAVGVLSERHVRT